MGGGMLDALGGAGATLADAGGVLVTAGMVPDVFAEAAGGIADGPLLARADGGGGGVVLAARADGGGGGLDRAGRDGGCGGPSEGGRDHGAGGGGGGAAALAGRPEVSRLSLMSAAAFASSTARPSSPASLAASAARFSQRNASCRSPFCQIVVAASSATATSLASDGSTAKLVRFESSVKVSTFRLTSATPRAAARVFSEPSVVKAAARAPRTRSD
jgi:hypothetical protein